MLKLAEKDLPFKGELAEGDAVAEQTGPRVGIREVARAAGVSIATVSNALNGTGRVDPGTRERVTAVARELGYRANPSARQLRRRRTGVLAVTAREPTADGYGLVDVEYFVEVMMAAASVALARGYSLTLVPASTAATVLTDTAVDGVLVFDVLRADPLVADLAAAGTSVVTVGRDTSAPPSGSWWVDNDMVAGTVSALDHLAGTGARRIGLLTGPPEFSYCADAEEAYRTWVAAHGYEPLVAHVADEPGQDAAGALLDAAEPPDGIFAVLERYALAVLTVAGQRHVRVPEDLALVGGSDSAQARHARVPVTVLDLHPGEVGRAAVELLIGRIEDEESEPVHRLVGSDLLVRASTSNSDTR